MGRGTVIVLDTHAWVWYVDNPALLGKRALGAIERCISDRVAYISSISAWEILTLESKGRLQFGIPGEVWIERCENTAVFHFVPVDNSICRMAVKLGLHGDPADRFIAATAAYLGASLVTKDRGLRSSKKLNCIW